MGARGPVPNRESDLARPRERRGGETTAVTRGKARNTRWPAADPDWHPLARDIYLGCKNSGQADFYQQSDIAILRSLMEDLSLYKNSRKRSGQMLMTIMSALSSLLVTEGDRRRVRIELSEEVVEETPASVSVLNDYRAQLGIAQ
ncbi:hypothetical protein ACIA8K_12695 [Catenuloplanes sp. NPDC051500]|uniref:phage terminase small subunit n=1 Tax=Catenuloplanes sp. NPDC051500 TaxID=3363959 RepID=UPI003791A3AE